MRGLKFRIWAANILKEYIKKGVVAKYATTGLEEVHHAKKEKRGNNNPF
jgi:hypothetical protein